MADKKPLDKLISIQQELKAPKGQDNSFGNFKFRSAADILEAVKPILKKHDCAIVLTDGLVELGERVYVQATATLYDYDGVAIKYTNGFAKEALVQKGMNDAMITGSTSSFARKYALNGLFAIDDSKDLAGEEVPAAKKKLNTKKRLNKVSFEKFISQDMAYFEKHAAKIDATKAQQKRIDDLMQ